MHTIFPKIPTNLIEEINKAKSIAIISHISPDGDALSSSLATREIMAALGKECIVLNDGPFKRKELDFLAKDIQTEVTEELKEKNPLVIIVDCSTKDRPGKVFEELSFCKTLVIDHHSSGELFVEKDLSYIVPDSPSTTLLIEELRIALGVKLTKTIAEYLYIGLLTDTGFFHFLNDKQGAHAFSKASDFVATGINPYELYDKMMDGKTLYEIKAVASIIEKSAFLYSGQLAIAVQEKEVELSNLSDNIYPQMLSITGIKAVVFAKEKDDYFELGFRAKRDAGIDVGAIASSLGGGGHKLAAGARVEIKKETIISFIANIFSETF